MRKRIPRKRELPTLKDIDAGSPSLEVRLCREGLALVGRGYKIKIKDSYEGDLVKAELEGLHSYLPENQLFRQKAQEIINKGETTFFSDDSPPIGPSLPEGTTNTTDPDDDDY